MKPQLFLLPIEPLEERYTSDWYRWLPESFGRAFNVKIIKGTPLTTSVESGAFLDINSTLKYKATQLAQVAELFHGNLVHNGDTFFVSDLEFWGIEAIRYLARLQHIDVKIVGFLHAASYTPGDYMEPMADIGQHSERAWLTACDLVFVGTQHHKQQVLWKRHLQGLERKLVVTGNPWRMNEAHKAARTSGLWRDQRDFDVIFPHRPDYEKRPDRFIVFLSELEEILGRAITVAFTTGRPKYRSSNMPYIVETILSLCKTREGWHVYEGLNRADFYACLARSKIVVSTTTFAESFGYAMVEGMAQGAMPIMPNAFSYPELVNQDYRFMYQLGDMKDAARCASVLLRASDEGSVHTRMDAIHYAGHLEGAEERMIVAMLGQVKDA